MQITTAMLADAARVESGKLYVHGGGWDRITIGSFPATHPGLAVVLVFRIEYDEALNDYPIAVTLETEDGAPMGPKMDGMISAGHPPGTKRGAPTFHPISITLNGIRFEGPGGFHFRVTADEQELVRIPFAVQERRRPPRKAQAT